VIHPWVSLYGLRLLAAITGWKGRRLRDLLAMECGVTRDNDDPWRAVPPYEDGAFGPRVFWGAAALMQLAADERSVLPSGAILDRLPVLPVAHRRPRRTSAGGLESDEATILYEELLQRIADWRIVRERGEPIQVWMTTRAVQRAVEALLLGRFAEPVADDEEDVDEDEDEEVAEEADDKDAEEADDEDAEEADDEDAEEADDEDAELDEDGVGESEAGEDGVDESEAGEEASHGGGDHPEDDEADGCATRIAQGKIGYGASIETSRRSRASRGRRATPPCACISTPRPSSLFHWTLPGRSTPSPRSECAARGSPSGSLVATGTSCPSRRTGVQRTRATLLCSTRPLAPTARVSC